MGSGQQTPSYRFGLVRDWPGYFRSVEGKGPRETLVEAAGLVESDESAEHAFAIDLGCGEGRDTAELLRRGFRVLALDGHPQGIERVLARTAPDHAARLEARVAAFETLEELPPCDLLNASFSLPFCPPDRFARVWELVTSSVRPGGVFAGQLFGDRHSWASIPDRSHHTAQEARGLLRGFDLVRFDDEERDAEDFEGHAMHWHLFHVVARRVE
ncbi:MAG: class I SAM-dependent methyltransferase [Planctomycetota bacterium]